MAGLSVSSTVWCCVMLSPCCPACLPVKAVVRTGRATESNQLFIARAAISACSIRSEPKCVMLCVVDIELVRIYADEVAWLAARLNRRTADMDALEPESPEFRDAVAVSEFLAHEISAALQKLRSITA